ncbi:MutS domain V [Pilibacter termitis]|uniref:MutS domain V n=1 Tax=Pilibacter termitis TaxID=263852 RepID=A0A1T4M5S9_9ENTE|nr:DNA mismatch repair protein MutS [Pilibacter termitis]SJZ62206.1 MutS domain V [Pilibacter termitis]
MTVIWLVLAIIVLAFTLNTVDEIRRKIKIRKEIKEQWGKLPKMTRFDHEESLREAWQIGQEDRKFDSEIDELTWYDLDMMHIFQQINATKSSIGSEYLYRKMREFDFDNENLKRLEHLITYLEENPETREKLQYLFAMIGKKDANLVQYYLKHSKKSFLPRVEIYIFLGILPVVLLPVAVIFQTPPAILIFLGSILLNMSLYLKKKIEIEKELICMSYLVNTFVVCKKFLHLDFPSKEILEKNYHHFSSVRKFAFTFRVKSGSDLEVIFDYFNGLFLIPLLSYNFVLKKLSSHKQEAVEILELLGELEFAIAILNFRYALPYFCVPNRTTQYKVNAQDVCHPLLLDGVGNVVAWKKSTLVTGSNASGKSTYIKAVAINTILSQTIHTAFATEFSCTSGHVLTSMAIEDDLFEGESYFIAETKSIKRILDVVETGEFVFAFIDEILKGTNTIERISASSSILEWLSEKNVLAFVATHDIELSQILQGKVENIHFSERFTEHGELTFDYSLKKGAAKTRNALKLLETLDFPTKVLEVASKRANVFDECKKWK